MAQSGVHELRVDDHMKLGDIEDSKLPAGYKSDSDMSPVSSNTGEKVQHNAGIDAEVANFFAAQGDKPIGECLFRSFIEVFVSQVTTLVIDEATNKRLKRMIDKRVLLVMVGLLTKLFSSIVDAWLSLGSHLFRPDT
jgi:hypothetical protein